MAKVNYAESVKEENNETKGFSGRAKNGLIILATVGIGMGVYGWINGRLSGYRDGYRRGRLEGMAYTIDNFADVMNELTKATRKSKGE